MVRERCRMGTGKGFWERGSFRIINVFNTITSIENIKKAILFVYINVVFYYFCNMNQKTQDDEKNSPYFEYDRMYFYIVR